MALIAAVVAWIWICAREILLQISAPSKTGIAICTVVVLAPIVLRNISKMPVFLLAAYAALVPFDDLLTTGAGATVTKLLAILTGASLVLSLVLMRRVARSSRTLFVFAVLTLYIGATVFWAIDPSRAFFSYGTYISYFALFAVISVYPVGYPQLRLIVICAIAGSVAAAGYGDYLFIHGQQVSGARLFMGGGETVVDPNEFAANLLMPVAIAIAMLLHSRPGFGRLTWYVVAAVLFSGFVISGSRGGAFSFAAIIVYLLLRSPHKKQLAAFGIAATIAILASPLAQRFGQGDFMSGNGRVDIWKVGLASLHQYWLTGAGVGNFTDAFTQYFLSTPHQPLTWDRVAHSIFVQSAVEYGIIGFLLLMFVWYLEFRELAAVRAGELVNGFCAALSAGLLGIFVAGFSLDLMTYKSTWLAFTLIALTRTALVTSGVQVEPPKRETEPAPRATAPLALDRRAVSTRASEIRINAKTSHIESGATILKTVE